jgi:hypothetical protein
MLTLATFLRDFIVSVAILYVTYGLARFAVHGVLRLIHLGWRFDGGRRSVETSGAGGFASISRATAVDPRNGLLTATMQRPSFPLVAIAVREAREALFAHQRRMFCSRSEIREIAARTRENIVQAKALMAEVDVVAFCCGNSRVQS